MSETWQELEGKVLDEKLLLVRYLGGSGSGAVFLADEIGAGVPTAIKLIPVDPQAPEVQLARLRAAERLSHPNLLRTLDAGPYEAGSGQFFYVRMEYAEENLAQLLPVRVLTAVEARQLLNALLRVLGYLHAEGFVHGRIKPSNIMAIGEQVKVSSDGLCPSGEFARLDAQSIYTAPETASEGITPAADSWSLGVTLLEALTGQPPAWGSAQDDPVVPDTLPAPFLDVVRHCLRRDPGKRWTLAEIAAGSRPEPPVRNLALTVPVAARQQKSGGRRYGLTSLAAAAIVAIVAGFILVEGRSSGGPASSIASQSATGSQPAEAPAASQAAPNAASPATSPAASSPAMRPAPDQQAASQPAQPSAPEPAQQQAANNSREGVVPLGLKQAVPANEQDFIVHREMPNVSQNALNTIHGTVRVRIRVAVDPSGNVARASFVSHGPSNYFAERAMQAAKQWKFRPPAGDQNLASAWLLRFQYRNSGTNVIPEQQRR